jgi:hypothetical protein
LDNIKIDLREIRVGGCGLDSCGSGWKVLAACYEHGNEPSGSINGREFID